MMDGMAGPETILREHGGTIETLARTIAGTTEAGEVPKRLSLRSVLQCITAEQRRYVVKGMIAAGDVVLLIGSPGTGKSALAPLLGYSVTLGRYMFGRRVRSGKVLYLPCEDVHGMRGRIHALKLRHGDAPEFFLVDGVTDLFSPQGQAEELRSLVQAEQPALVVIDTIAAGFPGMRENESDDMGRVIRLARDMTRRADGKPGPAVVLVHHVPKNGEPSARGHGNLAGDADVEIRLAKDPDAGTVQVTFGKNRNGPSDGVCHSFTIEAVAVGTDEDGDEITAPVAVECGGTAGPRPVKLSPSEKTARRFLADLLVEQGRLMPGGPGFPTEMKGTEETAWRQSCESRRLSTAETAKDRSRTFRETYKALLQKRVVGANDGWVWLVHPEGDEGIPLRV